MGKTTNALELVVRQYFAQDLNWEQSLAAACAHYSAEARLALKQADLYIAFVQAEVGRVSLVLKNQALADFDRCYDLVVSLGELLSARLLAAVLNERGLAVHLADARLCVHTDATHRSALVDAARTYSALRMLAPKPGQVVVMAGFIGSDEDGHVTTLGREGSDYTAALVAQALGAAAVTVWKDVPGVLSADPKLLAGAHHLPHLSYELATELTYYGASVIHPKTLAPLAEAGIPLYVKSFVDPALAGTKISHAERPDALRDIMVCQPGLVLVSCQTAALSFITEQHLGQILACAARAAVRIYMVQSSARVVSLVIAEDINRAERLLGLLKEHYAVSYNEGLTLYMFKYASAALIQGQLEGKTQLLRQQTRTTLLALVKA